jgi:hypothetical protein
MDAAVTNASLLLVLFPFLCYGFSMTLTQTIKIPSDRRLIIDVPREIPTESVIISFRPADAKSAKHSMTAAQEAEYFRLHADKLNAEVEDVLLYQKPIFEDNDR